MIVKEMFGPTVQGEGSMAGMPCSFLRLTGCNRWSGLEKHKPSSFCYFCDTDFVGGDKMTAEEVSAKLYSLGQQNVVVTGGEPTLQLETEDLKILSKFDLYLETNGSNPLGDDAQYFKHITMSPKQKRSETHLEFCTDLKILFPYVQGVRIEDFIDFPHKHLFLQPIWDLSYPENLKKTLQECYRAGARLSLQTHKILGVQ